MGACQNGYLRVFSRFDAPSFCLKNHISSESSSVFICSRISLIRRLAFRFLIIPPISPHTPPMIPPVKRGIRASLSTKRKDSMTNQANQQQRKGMLNLSKLAFDCFRRNSFRLTSNKFFSKRSLGWMNCCW